MSEAFIVRRGGNGSGAVLTINAPAGVTAKITKGDKTKTKTVSNGGAAVFSGLSEGMWMASILDGTSLETTPVPVNVITNYHLTLSFFSATINITYPSGSTCTVSNGNITLTAPNTSGTWSCTVPEAGTWTVTATDGTNTKSETVEIAQSGESVNVELAYWNGELYDMGDEFASVTGGWAVSGYKFDGGSGGTLNTDHIYLPIAPARSTIYAGTQNAVDITGWNQINISYATSEGGELTTISVDVSSVDGTYFVAVSNYVTFDDMTINIGILQGKESGYLAKKSVVRTGAKYVYKIWMS